MKLLAPFFLALLAAPLAFADYSVKETPGKHIDILDTDGKTVARIMTAGDVSTPELRHENYKVYTHVFDKQGEEPITKGAGGQFTHHRGIFLGWSKTKFGGKGIDSWHMKGCTQAYQRILKQETAADHAKLNILVHWQTDDGEVFLKEERQQTFRRIDGNGAYLQVDLVSILEAPIADVELKGDPEHAGCQFRPSQEVAKNKSAKYLFHQEGTDPKKDKDLPWVAESFTIGDKNYFAQHISHPSTPKGNTYSAYRDYGRFGAYCVATVPKGERLTLSYRIIVGEGEMPAREAFAERYSEYIGDSK